MTSKALPSRQAARPTSGAARPPQRPDRREAILATAASLVASRGYTRTSLRDVAEVAGILPGSLYHHFESKEAMAVELVERYQAELDELGRTAQSQVHSSPAASCDERIIAISIAVAESSVRHQAALQLTIYEPPSGAGSRLVALSRRRPAAAKAALEDTVRRGQMSGVLRPDLDPAVLAEQLVTSMRRIGVTVVPDGPIRVADAAATLCHVLLGGIAAEPPGDDALDGSSAMRAAADAVEVWRREDDAHPPDKETLIRTVARAEFGRRGYEGTSIRDIAAAAGLPPSTVYRFIESKESLLTSIMALYYARLADAYREILSAGSSIVEQIDALTWLNTNAMERFQAEFEIQHAWLREVPPEAAMLDSVQRQRVRQLSESMAAGLRDGQLQIWSRAPVALPSQLVVMCMHSLMWVPREIVEGVGVRASLAHTRSTTLRGAWRGVR